MVCIISKQFALLNWVCHLKREKVFDFIITSRHDCKFYEILKLNWDFSVLVRTKISQSLLVLAPISQGNPFAPSRSIVVKDRWGIFECKWNFPFTFLYLNKRFIFRTSMPRSSRWEPLIAFKQSNLCVDACLKQR